MYCLVAHIFPKPGFESHVEAELMKIAEYATRNETGTLGYHVIRSKDGGFITFERYRDEEAMQAHNDSPACAEFFAAVEDALERVDIAKGSEIFGS